MIDYQIARAVEAVAAVLVVGMTAAVREEGTVGSKGMLCFR